ncbi:hypothetical protein HMPREF9597_01189 [Cutibacterium acnes HL005PA4]|nr:hypothetical protein HMPREF9574_01693 [Cutibacterium acnes HL074PA1]EFS56500.1 hypothetical protein HMPREF9593_01471 [Cutibacterium acnes HL046PA2]EFS71338.1 hypothetical protein HMPREF9617_01511 [Cutibacterium acnes HL056PA1]EFS79529.1 hypothetical protein HMPREF9597_01189 [Cutibacterium acnes HL005PA4]EFT27802.1 hypothetical protein HMPREF9594_01930 [Cutibacterium acnes HL005PA1]EFT52385.1 hypothetical protein HMPREF9569_01691 [Cutibacterium acnes HL078PA1]EFT80731.1 hypothetical protein
MSPAHGGQRGHDSWRDVPSHHPPVITAADSRGEYAGHLDSATRRYESSGGMPAEDILDEKVTHDA